MNNNKQHHTLNGGKNTVLDANKNIGQVEETKREMERQLFDPMSGSMVTAVPAASSAKKKHSSKDKKKKEKQNATPPRIACIAEESLIQRIKQIKLNKQSLADKNIGENGMNNSNDNNSDVELIDLPKEMINTLPEVPYKRTKKIVVVTNATASNLAVALIRKELTSTIDHHHHQQQQQQLENDNNECNSPNVPKTFHYLGFDIETRPKYHKGGTNNPPALLQLATSTTAYLFRLKYDGMKTKNCPMTNELKCLLSDTTIIKVGIGIHKDIIDMKSVYGPDCCGDGTSYLDLTPLVKLKWPRLQRCGLRNLTATVLQYRLSKAQQMKNWEIKVLTRAMEEYAGADAFVALDLLGALLSS